MKTYEKIKQLKGKENKHMINALRYIAKEENCLSKEEIQYKKLFYKVLKPEFIKIATKHNLNANCISRKQYNHLRKYNKGRFPISICIYLETLYLIMLKYNNKADLDPIIDDISYTQYILDGLRDEIFAIVNWRHDRLIDIGRAETYNDIYNNIIALDNYTGNNELKIYNNIW